MALQSGPFARSIIGVLSFIILFAVIVAAGPNTALVIGGLSLLGGFAALGDRRRNSFVGVGMIAFGAVLLITGIAMK